MDKVDKERSNTTNIRENLIITAVDFLTNKNVKKYTITQKQKFLRSKGLTEEEIEIASNRAGIFSKNFSDQGINTHTIINMDRRQSSLVLQPRFSYMSTFSKIKELFSSLAFISSMVYAVYLFYKNFVKSLLFGEKKPKTINQKLDDLTLKVETDFKQIHKEIDEIKENILKNCQTQAIKQELEAFQHDLDKIRGLLLNKKQFANPTLPSMTPSIPQWQLDAVRIEDGEDKNEDSGSGTSEAENVTKNSDSSLEIM